MNVRDAALSNRRKMAPMNALGKVLRLLLLAASGAVLGVPPASAGTGPSEPAVMPAAGATMQGASIQGASMSDPCCKPPEKIEAPCEHPGLCAAVSAEPRFVSVAGHGFAASSAGHESAGRPDGVPVLIPPDQALRLPGRKLSVLFCSFQI